MSRVGLVLLVVGSLFVSSLAAAQRSNARPSARTIKRNMVTMTEHPNNFRYQALRAAGIEKPWSTPARVHQIGSTRDGMSIVTVRSPALPKMAVLLARRVQKTSQYGNYTYTTTEVEQLSDADLRTMGLVTGPTARARATDNGGRYRNVRGRIRYAGVSRSGESQKIEVTPVRPVEVRETYGTRTVRKLTRYIHVNGAETAAVTDGDWRSNNEPVRRTRPAISSAANQ